MYSKNIICFLILALLTLTKINGDVIESYTGKCNDIYKYLEGQGKLRNLNVCKMNNKGDVTELRVYPYCLTNQDLKTLLSYKTIETLEFSNVFYDHIDLNDNVIENEFNCRYYDDVPTNFNDFIGTLTNLKFLDMVGMMNNDINIITKIPKSIEVLKIGEIISEDMILTQKLVDVLSTFTNLTSLTLREIGISVALDFRKFANLKNLTSLEIFYHDDFYPWDIYITEKMLKNFKHLKKLIIYEATLDDDALNTISNMTELEELRLDLNMFDEESNFTYINKLNKLTSLVLNCGKSRLSTNLFDLTQLKRLSLRNCELLNTSNNSTLTYSTLKNLEYLNIKYTVDNYNYFDLNYLGDLTSLKEAHIYDHTYTSLPESIGNLKNLEIFDLDGSKLDSVPKSLYTLENLKILKIDGGNSTSISDEIGNLKNLEELTFFYSQITSLPESIGNLINLKSLDASHNKIVNIPESLKNLSKLENLYLNNNNISEFPKSILNLNITVLHLNNNSIETIPDEIGNMKNLESLQLYNNKITNIPSSIGDLTNLTYLDIMNNWGISSLPESIGNLVKLKTLNAMNTNIVSLPDSINNLKNLEKVYT